MRALLTKPTPGQRRWAYRVLTAAGAVALVYGVLNAEQVAVWLGLANAVLGGLADANVPTDDDKGRHEL